LRQRRQLRRRAAGSSGPPRPSRAPPRRVNTPPGLQPALAGLFAIRAWGFRGGGKVYRRARGRQYDDGRHPLDHESIGSTSIRCRLPGGSGVRTMRALPSFQRAGGGKGARRCGWPGAVGSPPARGNAWPSAWWAGRTTRPPPS
jgi:hypothetical protein